VTCQFAHLDGSYVLGALSPAERQEFEQHLAGCAECAQSVRELAGLPGLLSRVDPRVLESPPAVNPVPDSLLPALVEQVRRTRRHRTFVTATVAAAAAAAVAVGMLGVTGAFDGERTPGSGRTSSSPTAIPTGPDSRAMQPVGSVPVRASLVLESVSWGTRLSLTCTYVTGGGDYEPAPAATYVLVVRTRDGRLEHVGTWRAIPGTTTRMSAATAASRADISAVEVRTENGKPVLRLTNSSNPL
jgi:hypothetical protein